jgi:hypothetical protein
VVVASQLCIAPTPLLASPENTMTMIGRIALHVIRIGLCALLIVQIIQMISALQILHGPEAFVVSPLLLAALAFKSILILLNLALLWLSHIGIRRLRPAVLPYLSNTHSHITGELR